jgi:hypothetical protein
VESSAWGCGACCLAAAAANDSEEQPLSDVERRTTTVWCGAKRWDSFRRRQPDGRTRQANQTTPPGEYARRPRSARHREWEGGAATLLLQRRWRVVVLAAAASEEAAATTTRGRRQPPRKHTLTTRKWAQQAASGRSISGEKKDFVNEQCDNSEGCSGPAGRATPHSTPLATRCRHSQASRGAAE